MITLRIATNFADVQRAYRALQVDVRDKAMSAALNRTITKGRAEMVRAITAEYAIRASDVRAQLHLRKAARQRLEAELEAFGRRRGRRSRNVILFGAREVKGKGKAVRVRFRGARGWATRMVRKGGGVSIKIKRGGPRKLIPGAFIGNQGRTVFIRTGTARLPIRGAETVDVPQMFNTRAINARVVRHMERELPKEFASAARRFTELKR